MLEVTLESLAGELEEGTVQTWFFEEGDVVNEGDDLLEVSTQDGTLTLQVPKSGVLAEVYYDEGEVIHRGDVVCTIDEDESSGGPDPDDKDAE